jgi:hypothetical protein
MYKINLKDNYMCKVTPNEWHVPKMVFSIHLMGDEKLMKVMIVLVVVGY